MKPGEQGFAAYDRWEVLAATLAGAALVGMLGIVGALAWWYATWALGRHVFPPVTYWWVVLGPSVFALVVGWFWQRSMAVEITELRAEYRHLQGLIDRG